MDSRYQEFSLFSHKNWTRLTDATHLNSIDSELSRSRGIPYGPLTNSGLWSPRAQFMLTSWGFTLDLGIGCPVNMVEDHFIDSKYWYNTIKWESCSTPCLMAQLPMKGLPTNTGGAYSSTSACLVIGWDRLSTWGKGRAVHPELTVLTDDQVPDYSNPAAESAT